MICILTIAIIIGIIEAREKMSTSTITPSRNLFRFLINER